MPAASPVWARRPDLKTALSRQPRNFVRSAKVIRIYLFRRWTDRLRRPLERVAVRTVSCELVSTRQFPVSQQFTG